MFGRMIPAHPSLAAASRVALPSATNESIRTAELLMLISVGVVAAVASTFLDFSLRIPGHAIIRSVFPMAFGLALAPRYRAGSVMGVSALASAVFFKVGGMGTVGLGAMTSLALTGPFLDLALWKARRGWRIYLAFVAAGVATNLVALTVRGSVKLTGLDHFFALPFAVWWIKAVPSYLICGALAGLLSASVWFQFSGAGRSAGAELPQ